MEARVRTIEELEDTYWDYPSYGWDWQKRGADNYAYYQRKLISDAKWDFDQVLDKGEEEW